MVLEARAEPARRRRAGSSSTWVPVGTIWADVRPGAGREDFTGAAARPRVALPDPGARGAGGAPSRPRADQRLREGARVFDILTVTEHDPAGRYLEIRAEEGSAAVSFAFAPGLQAEVYQRLVGDAALGALVGGAIYDAPLGPGRGRSAHRLCHARRGDGAGERHQDERRARSTTSW